MHLWPLQRFAAHAAVRRASQPSFARKAFAWRIVLTLLE
jgi:hypothetical protein